jgi:hypothetical protein
MMTNIQLRYKSGYYELVADNWQTTFCLEQISLLKMHKKYNYESIFMYLLFFIVSCLLLTQIYSTPFLLFLFLFFFTLFWFLEFIYMPIYAIELSLDSELFLFETKNKDLYQDFIILQYFYNMTK